MCRGASSFHEPRSIDKVIGMLCNGREADVYDQDSRTGMIYQIDSLFHDNLNLNSLW
jgi:hypothetical protein